MRDSYLDVSFVDPDADMRREDVPSSVELR
jgi:hypothetical protein